MSFKSKHNLTFEVAPWEFGWVDPKSNIKRFRIGTCHGLWGSTKNSYFILAIDNRVKGNGHFEDVLEIFEHSCKRDGKHLMFLEFMNDRFLKHLITKRGFTIAAQMDNTEGVSVIKTFRK